jgi:predicted outer membrane repeat protein
MKTRSLLLLIPMFLCSVIAAQNTIHVPQDHTSIQTAIDLAEDGDLVLVDTGTYYENINFRGKAITVASRYYIDEIEFYRKRTIINGSRPENPDSASVVSFTSGEDNNSVLYGFTITGGKGTYSTYEITGGGIYIHNSWPKISHNFIIGNNISNTYILMHQCMGAGIGGFYSYDANETKVLSIDHNTIKNNEILTDQYHALGAGIGITSLTLKDSNNTVHLRSNNIVENIVQTHDVNAYGGGLYIQNMQAVLIHNRITNNQARGHLRSFGGGVAFVDDNTFHTYLLNLEQNTISGNYCDSKSESYGGGIFIRGGTLEMEKNILEDNSLSLEGFVKHGGGICLQLLENPGRIGHNEFNNNSAISGKGGAICAISEEIQYLSIEGNLFSYDSAANGGAIRAEDCDINFYNNVFIHNHAQQGGALSISGYGNNTTANEYRLINNTFSNNRASYNGGALFTNYNDPIIINNIFFDDQALRGKEIFSPPNGMVEIAYTNINTAHIDGHYYDGFGLFEQDPAFCDSLGYDCMIGCTSPCINSGIEEYISYLNGIHYRCPEYDILMNPRPLGGAIDIGAFELFPFDVGEPSSINPLSLMAYPNPVFDILNIEYDIVKSGMVEIEFYNMAGSKVMSVNTHHTKKGKHKMDIDLGSLPSGVYFCRLITTENTLTKKIIKQ